MLKMKRIYEPAEPADGWRVLVDRLWPRGIAKESARIDEWPKDITPSTELRKWYHEDVAAREAEFEERYLAELDDPEKKAALKELRAKVKAGPVTLVTSAKDVDHSHVPVLARRLRA
jgi:uncharacterized protein YeaO (DUF488 family)